MLARSFQEQGSVLLPVFQHTGNVRPDIEHTAAGLPCDFLDLREFNIGAVRRLLYLIRTYEIEIVHWNFLHPLNGFVWSLSAAKPRLIHFLTNHGSVIPGVAPRNNPLIRAVTRVLLRRYAKALCISDFLLDCLLQNNVWSNLARCRYFVNTDRFVPNDRTRVQVRSEFGVRDSFVVLVVAHLIAEKGVDVAIRSMALLPEDVVLWIAGQGRVAGELQSLTTELGLASRVRFLGNQRRVEPFMQAADCLACPSVWGEAVGLSNLEALASGLPVIASAVGGIPEFIEDGHNGYLFQPGDALALAERIGRLRRDVDGRRTMACNARATAVEHFSVDARISDWLDVYRLSLPHAST